MTIGKRIAEQRKKLGISQEALGDAMGVSRQAISKWEADGAIPEIDKLIGLSKLFGVSVGWLLGVEETSAPAPPAQQDTLSDQQLRIIEEIVKKYQLPKKDPRRTMFGRILAGSLAALLLFGAVVSLPRIQEILADSIGLYHQLNGIRNTLSSLEERVASMESNGIRQAAPALLADYSFEIQQQTDQPGPLVSFTATPNSWQEGDTGYLDIRGADGALVHTLCDWSGSFLSAQCALALEDGNTLCFTLVHADGTQDQQMLYDESVQDLKSALSITIDTGEVEGIYGNNILRLDDFWVSTAMPFEGLDDETIAWAQIDLVLVRDRDQKGEEVGRFSFLDDPGSPCPSSMSMWIDNIQFQGLELTTSDYLDLYIEAAMSNGITARHYITTVRVDQNGKLV